MDKLIVTVTVDSRVSYPGNHYCPEQRELDRVADEYICAIDAGASIAHIHGVRSLEREIQPDGRRVSKLDFDGWQGLQDRILSARDCVMQFGIASARFEAKVELMKLHPDMMAIAFNAHDEFFQPDGSPVVGYKGYEIGDCAYPFSYYYADEEYECDTTCESHFSSW